ncbi:DNA polymerase III subunit beta [Candidatus Pantoea edessiphila]|uniref:Beta sliding clamp n=1 Tax=Candidatus Pantoea edessiphila TaxID=2044610 RepID=A0A2P5SXB1_9GAMM|nr:DNA polymerase III subunit beta [Candidatus Pantoea edessiphila]MBK4775840.1 DNA polymerase III subunit beta [Pantoea sp. Edef]PPI86971.1 DNA polymerase III subunit beta [Candidatus Pantoea edessiphila]
MKLLIEREKIIKPLQQISSVLNSRPVQQILGNILIKANDRMLFLTGTDLEIEMIACVELLKLYEHGSITVPARKFLEICRNIPSGSIIDILAKQNRMLIISGNINFSLSTLPSSNFPDINDWNIVIEFDLLQDNLKKLIEFTQFSMGNQDIRHYLNGIMFEIGNQEIRTVATDGHRLATYFININNKLPKYSIVLPRKGVTELSRILNGENINLKIQIGSSNIRIHTKKIIFTSRLINGIFPNYRQVLEKPPNKSLEVDCTLLKQALSRASILSNEKFRGVRLHISKNQLIITTSNYNHEKSEEKLAVKYSGDKLEICFNVIYIIDVLNTLKCSQVRLSFINSISSMHIQDINNPYAYYVVMPMRI